MIAFWVKIRPATPRLRSGFTARQRPDLYFISYPGRRLFYKRLRLAISRNNKQLIAAAHQNSIVAQLVMVFRCINGWRICRWYALARMPIATTLMPKGVRKT